MLSETLKMAAKKTSLGVQILSVSGGCSSAVRASEFYSEDIGFDPLAGQGESFSAPLQDNSCADLFVPDPPLCVRHWDKQVI